MITSKQRSFLRSMAHNLDPVVYIGKFGVTENVEKEIDNCLQRDGGQARRGVRAGNRA